MLDSISHADRSFGEIVDETGGIDAFLDAHAVILMADHAQTDVDTALPLAQALGEDWRVLAPNAEQRSSAELAVSPTARAAGIYLLAEDGRRSGMHAGVRARLRSLDGVDLVAWLSGDNGADPEAVVESSRGELRFRPGSQHSDRRGVGWDLDGEPAALALNRRDGGWLEDAVYPDGLARLWSALTSPNAGDLLVSLEEGYECVDWGGATHIGGASHGALLAGDSLGPLVLCGLEPGVGEAREQWALRDVAALVLAHFGVDGGAPAHTTEARAQVAP